MIISKKLKYVFVSTPKAGTHTMYRMLPARFAGTHLAILQGRKEPIPHHMREVPPEFQRFFTFANVRNPFDRAVSIWWTLTRYEKYRADYLKVFGSDEFGAYVRWQTGKMQPPAPGQWFLFLNQTDWLSAVPRIDRVLHIENLVKEFNSLPFVKQPVDGIEAVMERRHDEGRLDWPEYYTKKLADNIREWARHDFENYGYPKDV